MDIVRSPYPGESQKLVVSLDIGTTYSGAAYVFLDPGEVPQIEFVTRYLNSPNLGSAKVPSILYYDLDGNFCGVENGVDFQDEDEFLRIKWWKLLMSPAELPYGMKAQMSTKLPKGKTIVDVFADFMGYLFESTKALFTSSEPNGEIRWANSSNNLELILTHPNGWGGPQQARLRTAAINAGIVPDTPAGRASVRFVSEGEASFNFCATHTQACRDLKPGEQVLVIDAGGGTIDISTYSVLSSTPLQVEELDEPECILQGGEFVTARARQFAQERWNGSKFDTIGDLSAFSLNFDEGVKRVFSNAAQTYFVKFGTLRDDDAQYGIKGGKFALSGSQVSGFFEPSVKSIVDSFKNRFKEHVTKNSFVFLVGGFATSPWLSEQLRKRLSGLGLRFCKPDKYTNKAVAVGAISFYLDSFVTGRVAKFTIGVPCCPRFKPNDPEHIKRERNTYVDAVGNRFIRDAFKTMLSRGTKVLEDHEVRFSLCFRAGDTPGKHVTQPVTKYTGLLSAPRWLDQEGDFQTLCTIRADISAAPLRKLRGDAGEVSYTREYEVVLLVGLTELKAQVAWTDSVSKKEKRSEAVVIYDDAMKWTK